MDALDLNTPTQPDDTPVAAEDDEQRLSDDDSLHGTDAESIVGFSIGKEQSRLLLPSTPAAEKSAAFDRMNEWGFFDGAEEAVQQEVLFNTLRNSDVSSHDQATTGNDASDGDKKIERIGSFTANVQEDIAPRGRSSMISFLGDTGVKRFLSNLSFNPLAEHSKGSQQESNLQLNATIDPAEQFTRRNRSNSLFLNKISWGNVSPRVHLNSIPSAASHTPSRSVASSSTVETCRDLTQPLVGKAPTLRKAASDDSILKPTISRHSTISGKSVLGDEPDLDHIKQQVNSRGRAIRDTLQTSLPQMPNIDLSALRPNLATKMFRDVERSIALSASSLRITESQISNEIFHTAYPRPGSPPKVLKSRSPWLDSALDQLTGDLIVMGGYRGSVLREAESPHRQLWVPLKVGLGVRKVNLEVGLHLEDEETMHDRIVPSGMLTHIGPVDMSRRLLKRLRSCTNCKNGTLRIWDFGYDWRLSPALLSRRFIRFLEELSCNKDTKRGAIVIAHSLGGLITRHAVNQRPELFAGVLYAGTPQHCVNILGPLRNGDDVLLSSKVLTAQVNFTFRTSFLLLPESGNCFINEETKEQFHVDFFDVDNWKRFALSPCIAPAHPPFTQTESKLFGNLSKSIPSLLSYSSPFANSKSLVSTPSPPSPREVEIKAEESAHPGENTVGIQISGPPPAATCTIPYPEATAYLRRVLAEILHFKKEMRHQPRLEVENRYPPHALIYGTSVPTVYGARVASRDAIKHADAYDNLAFASGDGVVLARAAMMPRGYKTVKGGRVRTERGHVSLLGDLEAVGKCLVGLIQGRTGGVGLGTRDGGHGSHSVGTTGS